MDLLNLRIPGLVRGLGILFVALDNCRRDLDYGLSGCEHCLVAHEFDSIVARLEFGFAGPHGAVELEVEMRCRASQSERERSESDSQFHEFHAVNSWFLRCITT